MHSAHSLPLLLFLTVVSAAVHLPPTRVNFTLPSDALSLLSFKSKADLDNNLLYTLTHPSDYCQWHGVKCVQGRIQRLDLRSSALRGQFPSDTLSRLDQLRVLSLRNNSLSGPIPNLSPLTNLKSLFLDQNHFSGTFPPSLLFLHRILILDLSRNNLTGPIPNQITLLDRLTYLRLDSNRFTGSIPFLNQSLLRFFNVSNNNLTGAVPVTPTLSRFGVSSFLCNPNLCGEILNRECRPSPPFFGGHDSAAAPLVQSAESQTAANHPKATPTRRNHKRVGVALGCIVGALILFAAFLALIVYLKKQRPHRKLSESAAFDSEDGTNPNPRIELGAEAVNTELEVVVKEKRVEIASKSAQKSGHLVFCGGERQMYSLEQLMRASAELLGRGTIGTTYKAVMDNRLVVTVKRLDASKTAITNKEMYERHMELVGGLRHPNLVPVRAYFQAKEERLIVYDYQPNGSLFNLIHGSRSTRAKPLHWTSCLKIAEDVAQGLAYIHQASRLIHGNLKSSNILFGSDFEACLTDYGLALLADPSSSTGDPDSEAYKAPELRKSSRRASPKSDVYAFGVLLLELLTGKAPSHHPFLAPTDMPDWVKAMRDDDFGEDNRLEMLVEVAGICSLTSPEQRPLMWQVLKMIQEIKDGVTVEDDTPTRDAYNRF